VVWIVDTGFNVCAQRDLLTNPKPTHVGVMGINQDVQYAKEVGQVLHIGPTLYAAGADANLISADRLVNMYNGYFRGDKSEFNIFDKAGQLVLKAVSRMGFWIVTHKDLLKFFNSRKKSSLIPSARAFSVNTVKHYSAEERKRAHEAFNLCALLGHPGEDKIITDLDNNTYPNNYLTSKDVKNAEELYGPCLPCIEGKMTAPSEPTSLTPPASEIGEHLHADLLPLSSESIGGNVWILFVIDEKSGKIDLIPLVSKTAKVISQAWEHLVAMYRSYGHTIKLITTDNERNFESTKTFLGMLGIRLTSTPAGLHQSVPNEPFDI
jgi:hypothetical protein